MASFDIDLVPLRPNKPELSRTVLAAAWPLTACLSIPMMRLGAAVLLILPGPVAAARADAPDAASETVDRRVAEILAKAADAYAVAPASSASRCDAPAADPASNEIVVCSRNTTRDQRIDSSAESDPHSRAALHALASGGRHTPWVSNLPDCTVERCIRIGGAPPPIHLIDLAKIPEPPPGSDADKIARGEKRAD